MHLQGLGVPPDVEAGMRWAQQAAERGHPQACFNLGKGYYVGERVTRDYVQAHFWFSRAREAAHPEAPSLLKELELFMTPEQLAQARRRAAGGADTKPDASEARR